MEPIDKQAIIEKTVAKEKERRVSKQVQKQMRIAVGEVVDYLKIGKDFYNKQPIYFDKSKVWWLWNDEECYWEFIDEIDLMNIFDTLFKMNSVDPKVKCQIIEGIKRVARKNKPQDIEPSWIQFKDMIYDIASDNKFKATHKYFVANPLPWKVGEFKEGEEEKYIPKINKLIETWVGPEEAIRLYELLAFVGVPSYFIHSFFFLYAKPGTGKGTFVNLLLKFVGRTNTVSTSLSRINSNPRFETKNWHRKLLITMSEVSHAYELTNSGIINQATGGDPLRAEVKGGGGFDFLNYGKFIYPTNKLLKIDAVDGFGRRVRTINFLTRFEKESDVLSNIPKKEFENLAAKSIILLRQLWKKGKFTGDKSISERMSEYQEISKTTLEQFINSECYTIDFDSSMVFGEFYAHYMKYLKENKMPCVNKNKVTSELRKNLGYEVKNVNVCIDKINKIYTSHLTILGVSMNKT